MAKLDKKFSQLSSAQRQKLITKHGSLGNAKRAWSDLRIKAGKKPGVTPTRSGPGGVSKGPGGKMYRTIKPNKPAVTPKKGGGKKTNKPSNNAAAKLKASKADYAKLKLKNKNNNKAAKAAYAKLKSNYQKQAQEKKKNYAALKKSYQERAQAQKDAYAEMKRKYQERVSGKNKNKNNTSTQQKLTRSDLASNKGIKGAIKELAKDGRLGDKDIQYLAKNYPEIKASDIRKYLANPKNSNIKAPKSNIKETLRSTSPADSQPTGKRSDLTDGKGIKGAIKILAADGKLGNKDIAFLAEKYPNLKASDIRTFLGRDKNSDVSGPKDNIKDTIRSTRGNETSSNVTDPNVDDNDNGNGNGNGKGNPPGEEVPGGYEPLDPEGIDKDTYSDLRKDLQTRGKFYEALYSGQGGKETVDGKVKFNISDKQAQTFLKQLELDATQRMQINPKQYGRTKGKKIFETIKMPDGTKVKRFTGEYEADLSKVAKFSNAEKYDAGGATRRQMFKDLRSNYTTERDRQKDRLKNSNDPTRFLTVFGQGDTAAFNEGRLKKFMNTGSAQRDNIRNSAKKLGVKSLGESNTDAIGRLSKSITDNAKVDSFADLRSDFMTKKQNIRSTLKS